MHVVYGGTGGVGASLVKALLARDLEIRAVVRRPDRFREMFPQSRRGRVEVVTADVSDSNSCLAAARGASHVYHAVNLPLSEWSQGAERVLENILAAAESVGASFIFPGNVFVYATGERGKVDESREFDAKTRLGRIRIAMEERIRELHAQGRVRSVVGRFPDFYGPNANNVEVVPASGKPMIWGSSPESLHEFIYVDDVGEALVTLALTEKAYGHAWHVPGPGMITATEWSRLVGQVTGSAPRIRVFNRPLLRLMGIVDRQMWHYAELFDLWVKPLQLDGRRWEQQIGPVPSRAYAQGILDTASALGLRRARA